MSQEILPFIVQFLKSQKELSIPGFGTLIERDSQAISNNKHFYPPKIAIELSDISVNNSEFIEFVKEIDPGFSEHSINLELRKFAKKILAVRDKGEQYEILGLCRFDFSQENESIVKVGPSPYFGLPILSDYKLGGRENVKRNYRIKQKVPLAIFISLFTVVLLTVFTLKLSKRSSSDRIVPVYSFEDHINKRPGIPKQLSDTDTLRDLVPVQDKICEIVIGSFRLESNAKELLDRVQKTGAESYIANNESMHRVIIKDTCQFKTEEEEVLRFQHWAEGAWLLNDID